jgi:hypothetical protein
MTNYSWIEEQVTTTLSPVEDEQTLPELNNIWLDADGKWDGPRVLVPIDLQGLVVSKSASGVTWSETGSTVVNSVVTPTPDPFNVLTNAPSDGVHLHWAMPDSMCVERFESIEKIQVENNPPIGTEVELPSSNDTSFVQRLPDRWIVLRLQHAAEKENESKIDAWIIESDNESVTELSKWSNSPRHEPTIPLTSIGPDVPTWCATYSDSKGRFTFHDPLKGTGRFSYLICGWYNDKTDDPLWMEGSAPRQRWTEIMAELNWSLDPSLLKAYSNSEFGETSASILNELDRVALSAAFSPRQCLLHGALLNIDVDSNIVKPSPLPTNNEVKSGVGHNAIESLAALLSGHLGANLRPDIEELFVAFGHDILSKIDHPDGSHHLNQLVHSSTFSSVPAGIIYDYQPGSDVSIHSSDSQGTEVVATPADPYHQRRDPVLILSDAKRSTRHGGDGELSCRLTGNLIFMKISQGLTLRSGLPHSDVPIDVAELLSELQHLANIADRQQQEMENFCNGDAIGISQFVNGQLPSPRAINLWSQPWVPLFMDFEINYYPVSENWSLSDFDFIATGSSSWPPTSTTPISIQGRTHVTFNTAEILIQRVNSFLKEEEKREEDEEYEELLTSADEDSLIKFAIKLQDLDILTATLDGIQEDIYNALPTSIPQAGFMTFSRIEIVDAFGQVQKIPTDNINIGLSMETPSDNLNEILLKPRIPQPSRLRLQWISNNDDLLPATNEDSEGSSPICCFLLPDHLDSALEIFDYIGAPTGQVSSKSLDWTLNGIQVGQIVWDPAPGSNTGIGGKPVTGNIHSDRLFDSLQKISLEDQMIEDTRDIGTPPNESALSAMLRVIDSTTWTIDPFSKRSEESTVILGHPIAVVRASLCLEIDERELPMSSELAGSSFEAMFGALTRETDGLLGFYLDDDYSTFHSVLRKDGVNFMATQTSNPVTHDYIKFDNNIFLTPNQPRYLTMLMSPHCSVHATSCLLPQTESNLPSKHISSPLKRIAPSFRMGPVLINPNSISLPVSGKTGVSWSWLHRPDTQIWGEAEVADGGSEMVLLDEMPELIEGWLKMNHEVNE